MKKLLLIVMVSLAMCSSVIAAERPAAGANARSGPCRADVETLCQGVKPGGGRIKQCMQENKDKLSISCKRAIAKNKNKAQKGEDATQNDNTSDDN